MPYFDYKAAKASGASDEDIAAYLSQKNANAAPGDSIFIRQSDLHPEAPTLPMASAHAETPPLVDVNAPIHMTARGGGAMPSVAQGAGLLDLLPSGAAIVGGAYGGTPGMGLGAEAGQGARDFIRHALGLPTPQNEGVAILAQGALNTGAGLAGEGAAAAANKLAPGLMEQALRGYQAIESKFPQVSAIREALERAVNVDRGDITQPLAQRASSSNRVKQAMFDSAKKADQLLSGADAATTQNPVSLIKPQTSVSLNPTQVPSSPAPIQETAGTFLGEVQAHSAIHDAALNAGVDPDMLLRVLRDPNPSITDISELWKHGLDSKALDGLRELTPLIDRADQARSAMQTIFQPAAKTTMVPAGQGSVTAPALRYTADDITSGVRDLLAKMKRSSTSASPDMGEIQGYLDQFMQDHPGMLKPSEADEIRQFAGTAAKNAIASRTAGGSAAAAATSPNWQLFNDAIQKTVRGRLASDVAGLAAQNSNTQQLMALARVLANAEKQMGPPMTKPVAAAAWRLGASPEGLSRIANALNNPMLQQMLSQGGRTAGPALGTAYEMTQK